MPFVTRTILVSGFLITAAAAAAYSAPAQKPEPIAQVYAVEGKAMVTSSYDNSVTELKKGALLCEEDSLRLDKNASLFMYFKSGGRVEVKAQDGELACAVKDVAPKAQPYGQNVPMFGAARGINAPGPLSRPASFFYPQEAVILDTAPSIEFTLYHGTGEVIELGKALLQIVKDSAVLDSIRFNDLAYGSPSVCQIPKLQPQTEYRIELRVELQKTLGNATISFPLYIAGFSDPAFMSKYAPFSSPVYRSFETASIDHKGKKRAITAFKQLVKKGGSPQPVIVVELFIP